ncbi:hypothetical protein, variant [Batrachochytrium dendrobatidis JEL423]|nr:hypothetical protein, variant [Batrachochytrium dendrobatidis JEL423]
MPSSDSESSSGDEDSDDNAASSQPEGLFARPIKPLVIGGNDDSEPPPPMEIANPNRSGGARPSKKTTAAKPSAKLDESEESEDEPEQAPTLSRRERETIEKERAKAHYFKLQQEGKTDQARADLARLALIRKQRELAAQKRGEATATTKKEESLNAGKALLTKTLGKK